MSRSPRVLSLSVCLGVIASAFGAYLNFSTQGGGVLTADCSVGAITGSVGLIGSWSTASGNEWAESSAHIGAEWTGAQPIVAHGGAPLTDDERWHEYALSGSGIPDKPFIWAETKATNDFSGSSQVMNPADPSWWWLPHVEVHQYTPVVKRWDAINGEWDAMETTQGEAWTLSYEPSENDPNLVGGHILSFETTGTYYSGAPSYGTPGPTSANANGGHFRGSFRFTTPMPHGTKIRVVFPYAWLADADADNATVNQWKEWMHLRCFSETQEEPGSEFYNHFPVQ